MIIETLYSYEESKKVFESIKNLPRLGNNKFVFLNVLSKSGKSCTVIFQYDEIDDTWIYKSRLNG